MEIKIKRIARKADYTIGKLYINNVYFCDTLEDTDRGLDQSMSLAQILKIKQKGRTAIPTGTYRVTVSVVSPRLGGKEPYRSLGNGCVPRILDVKGSDGVLIHIGNYPQDTDGCPLVGRNTQVGAVLDSRKTYKAFWDKIKNEKVITLTII